MKAKVIKITKNILTDRIEKIELGSFKPNLATTFNNAIQGIKKEIVQVRSDYQTAIDNATSLITGSKGGNVVIRQGEDKKPYEILIMDTEDVNTAENVWRWNLGGFGYSSTGINGPYNTAITMDGHIVGSFITALEISANQIIGGTLTLGGAAYGNGVIVLRNDADEVIGIIDKTGIDLSTGTYVVGVGANQSRLWGDGLTIGTGFFVQSSASTEGWTFVRTDRQVNWDTQGHGVDMRGAFSCDTEFNCEGEITAWGVTNGNIYAENNISALSSTDRTIGYDGNALNEIALISNDKNGNIDHKTLPKFAQKRIKSQKIKLDKDGKKIYLKNGATEKEEFEEDGRDLGAMISILTVGIQQLTELVTNQATEIENLKL